MRLGQLSRKVSVRPAEIVSFLSGQGVVVDDNTNTRVSDDAARMVFTHFAPHLKFEETSEEIVVEETTAETPVEAIASEAPAPMNEPLPVAEDKLNEQLPESAEEEVRTTESELPQVIKAPKAELQGLKVIGKIELPEPKKKENAPAAADSENQEVTTSKPERKSRVEHRRPPQTNNQGSTSRARKNPIALQREREAREAEERKKADLEKEKEKRTQYYMQRVKPAAPARRASLVDEPLSQLKDEAPDAPKTLWAKFVKWLTSH
jgi:hypothetical protein